MNDYSSKTVILANGQFPAHAAPLAALLTAARIVCCDGAVDKLAAAGLTPTWVVGDLDSLSEAARARDPEKLVGIREQETNDLTKAFRFCLSHGWRDLVIVGATGLREDHTLGNLSLLVDFACASKVVLLTDTGWFTPLTVSARLPASAGQQVSIFSFGPVTAVHAEGLKYPLDGLRLTRWWQAALNESCGDTLSLVFEGGPLLIFQTYDVR
ncbi:MAG: thiamine diphosphokinase [bacterium]